MACDVSLRAEGYAGARCRLYSANLLFRFETSCALNGKNERVLSPRSSTGRRATVHLEEAYVIA